MKLKSIQEVEDVVQALERQVEELVALTNQSLSRSHSRATTVNKPNEHGNVQPPHTGDPHELLGKLKLESLEEVSSQQQLEITSLKGRIQELEAQQSSEALIYGSAMAHLEEKVRALESEKLKREIQIVHLLRTLDHRDRLAQDSVGSQGGLKD